MKRSYCKTVLIKCLPFLLKMDPSGDVEWKQIFNYSSDFFLRGVDRSRSLHCPLICFFHARTPSVFTSLSSAARGMMSIIFTFTVYYIDDGFTHTFPSISIIRICKSIISQQLISSSYFNWHMSELFIDIFTFENKSICEKLWRM